ncbi:MAG: heavy metal-binding domain-containing protein, partial [Actinomycetia bacterium]|nr:heavy metal-binding domain-containing protein [Actinomycetes bacterium]
QSPMGPGQPGPQFEPPQAQPPYGQPGPGDDPGQPYPGQPGQPQPPAALQPSGGGQPSSGPQAPGGWAPVQQTPKVSPVPEPKPRAPQFTPQPIPMTTGDALPGADLEVVGVVFGVAVRSSEAKVGPETMALLAEARVDALAALADMATQAGGDAVVAIRFDGGRVSEGLREVTAYGTAVKTRPAGTPASAASASATETAPAEPAPDLPAEADASAGLPVETRLPQGLPVQTEPALGDLPPSDPSLPG